MAEKIRLHLMEDGYCLEVDGTKSDVVGYGEVAELAIAVDGTIVMPAERYIAAVDFAEDGERDAAGVDISGQEFPLTDYWVYKVSPVFDNEIEFVEEEPEAVNVTQRIISDSSPVEVFMVPEVKTTEVQQEQEQEKGKEDHVETNE